MTDIRFARNMRKELTESRLKAHRLRLWVMIVLLAWLITLSVSILFFLSLIYKPVEITLSSPNFGEAYPPMIIWGQQND
jgi:hypothetical protein